MVYHTEYNQLTGLTDCRLACLLPAVCCFLHTPAGAVWIWQAPSLRRSWASTTCMRKRSLSPSNPSIFSIRLAHPRLDILYFTTLLADTSKKLHIKHCDLTVSCLKSNCEFISLFYIFIMLTSDQVLFCYLELERQMETC